MERVVIDPITRIEGHLKIEVEVNDRRVTNAWSSGTLFRGIELILQGRDPRDANLITQRACGVCTYVHSLASIRAVDNALGSQLADNGRIIRTLLLGSQYLHDHIVHFYHLQALDWVDIVSALKADPRRTEALAARISRNAHGDDVNDFFEVQNRLKKFVESGQLGPFANGYWGHPAYRLPPEANLLIVTHYLAALRQQTRTARLMAIFGGKNPHTQSMTPGGVTCATELSSERIGEFKYIWEQTMDFVDNVYLPDMIAIASFYKDWGRIGGTGNFLTYGDFPMGPKEPDDFLLPGGVIFNRNLDKIEPVDVTLITEQIKHSWYEGKPEGLNPARGETKPDFTKYDTKGQYSWIKAPRYKNEPMEVGPLARVLVAYGKKVPAVEENVDLVLEKLAVPKAALFSTLGRTAARAIETKVVGDAMGKLIVQLVENIKKGDLNICDPRPWDSMPADGAGVGLNDVPRGALGHWITVKDRKIVNYQMVVPSTWNLGPRDAADKMGPVEEALVGAPVFDTRRPVEILRIVHSFDPCLACAVHLIDAENEEVYKFDVV